MQKALFRSAKEPVLQIGNREQKIRKLQPHFGNSKVWATKTEDILRRKIHRYFLRKRKEKQKTIAAMGWGTADKIWKKRNGRVVKLSPINKSGGLGRQNGKKYDAKHTCDKWGIYISAM